MINIVGGEINSVNTKNRKYILYNEQNICIKFSVVIKCDKRAINCALVRSSISGNGVVWASIHGGNNVAIRTLGDDKKLYKLIRTYWLRC
jgi:hypothetical protein